MDSLVTFATKPVVKEEFDAWLTSFSPLTGQLHAFVMGLALGAVLLHEERFGMAWERRSIIVRLQTYRHPFIKYSMWFLGQFCSADFLVPYFAFLYWILDPQKCYIGIWLVPICEISNGLLKWTYRVPRPGWVDDKVKMRAWSHEFSFPSSHAQMTWALATFFTSTSIGTLRTRLLADWGNTQLAYWVFLLGPFIFAFFVSLSRVYEGVHYPRDVCVGAGIGITVAGLYVRSLPFIFNTCGKWDPNTQMICLLLISMLWSIASVLTHDLSIQSTPRQQISRWQKTAASGKNAHKTILPYREPLSSYIGMCGVLVGLSLGVPHRHIVPLTLPITLSNAVLRFIIGNVVLLSVYFAIRLVEKKVFANNPNLQRLMRLTRYSSVPLNILLCVPWLFNKYQI